LEASTSNKRTHIGAMNLLRVSSPPPGERIKGREARFMESSHGLRPLIGPMNRRGGAPVSDPARSGTSRWSRRIGDRRSGSWRAPCSFRTCSRPMNAKCVNGWKSRNAFSGSWEGPRWGWESRSRVAIALSLS